jgi:hypothetical protein
MEPEDTLSSAPGQKLTFVPSAHSMVVLPAAARYWRYAQRSNKPIGASSSTWVEMQGEFDQLLVRARRTDERQANRTTLDLCQRNVTCGSLATPAMLMRQSVGRVKLAKLVDSTPKRGAMSDVVGTQITLSSPMRFWTNVRSAAQWVRASCHASDTLQQDVEIKGGPSPEIQCMRLQKGLSGPSPLVVQQGEEFPFRVELGGSPELR